MLMLCWKLLEINTRFSNYLMETERGLDLMVVLIFYANENKLDPSQVGLVRMCAFMLQTLSSNRIFSVKINKAFDGHASLPASCKITNFQGSYANYLILVCFFFSYHTFFFMLKLFLLEHIFVNSIIKRDIIYTLSSFSCHYHKHIILFKAFITHCFK
jgi:hypothetical protein